jgi:hypothetical protein
MSLALVDVTKWMVAAARGRLAEQAGLSPDPIYDSEADTIQFPSSEGVVVDALAKAMCGLSAAVVLPRHEDRDRFVKSVVERVLSAPHIRRLAKPSDSARRVAFGCGMVYVVASNSDCQFGYALDSVATIGPCDPEGVNRAHDRMAGSLFRFLALTD